ncbi:MAG: hypothetical protein ABIH27_07175 [Candidatus Omnitrophota bacterium]
MKLFNNLSVTLIELLLAIALLWLVLLATSNISLFSHGYLLNADRKVKLQNELTLIADDICKNVARAPGELSNRAVTVSGTRINVRNFTGGNDIIYDLNSYKIQKDFVDFNINRIIANFTPSYLDNGIGVELNITGRSDPSNATAINNPQVNITTRCYSHQASAR